MAMTTEVQKEPTIECWCDYGDHAFTIQPWQLRTTYDGLVPDLCPRVPDCPEEPEL